VEFRSAEISDSEASSSVATVGSPRVEVHEAATDVTEILAPGISSGLTCSCSHHCTRDQAFPACPCESLCSTYLPQVYETRSPCEDDQVLPARPGSKSTGPNSSRRRKGSKSEKGTLGNGRRTAMPSPSSVWTLLMIHRQSESFVFESSLISSLVPSFQLDNSCIECVDSLNRPCKGVKSISSGHKRAAEAGNVRPRPSRYVLCWA